MDVGPRRARRHASASMTRQTNAPTRRAEPNATPSSQSPQSVHMGPRRSNSDGLRARPRQAAPGSPSPSLTGRRPRPHKRAEGNAPHPSLRPQSSSATTSAAPARRPAPGAPSPRRSCGAVVEDRGGSAASAPACSASTRCSSVPAPPEAITGTPTASRDRARSARGRSRPRCRRGPSKSAGSRPRRARRPRAPIHRVAAGRGAAAGDEDLPAAPRRVRAPWRRSPARRTARRSGSPSSSISSRPRDSRGVDRDLVGAGVEHGLRVGDRADPAADRERDEDVVGGAPRQLDDRVALARAWR